MFFEVLLSFSLPTILNLFHFLFRVVSSIVNEIERSISESSFLKDFKMSELPALQAKFVELLELLVSVTPLKINCK